MIINNVIEMIQGSTGYILTEAEKEILNTWLEEDDLTETKKEEEKEDRQESPTTTSPEEE